MRKGKAETYTSAGIHLNAKEINQGVTMILFVCITFLILFLMLLLLDMPDWSKTHHDHKKGSYHEISNRK